MGRVSKADEDFGVRSSDLVYLLGPCTAMRIDLILGQRLHTRSERGFNQDNRMVSAPPISRREPPESRV